MSCRIMGRNIEFAFMDQIVMFLKSKGCITIEANYLPTQKNKPVVDFYERAGLALIEEKEGAKHYAIDTEKYKFKNIKYITIK